jgi:D-alanyl-D-alanine carboxypeptidase/D-alanyl-D-alanine-endopeptidase (penicillin-binding protein 4)
MLFAAAPGLPLASRKKPLDAQQRRAASTEALPAFAFFCAGLAKPAHAMNLEALARLPCRLLLPLALALAGLQGAAAATPAKAAATQESAGIARILKHEKIPESAVALFLAPVSPKAAPAIALNADKPMSLASTMKLVTTYAALSLLGPTHTWQTVFYSDAPPDAQGRIGNLYIKGGGDPSLTAERFWRMLWRLHTVGGVNEIDGKLIIDRSAFALPGFDAGAFDQKPQRAYNAGPDALLLDYQAVAFHLAPDAAARTVRAALDSPRGDLALSADIQLDQRHACSGWRDMVSMHFPDAKHLELSGAYPEACGEKTLYLAMPQADAQVLGLFSSLWPGKPFSGSLREAKVPEGATELLSADSPPLSELLREVNKWSNNVMARQVFLSLGREDPKTLSASRAALSSWLAQEGLRFPELSAENGSGLSRNERLTARHLAQLLQSAWQSPWRPELLASLPVLGVDGTLKKRLAGTPLAGQARLKTGTLDGVRAAAGFLLPEGRPPMAFVMLINHPNADEGAIDKVLEKIIWPGLH